MTDSVLLKCVTVEAATSGAFQTAMAAAMLALQAVTPGPNGGDLPANIITIQQGAFVDIAAANALKYWATIYYTEVGPIV